MHDTTLDDETVAAFLDGRLSPGERQRVFALIAASDEWREVLGEAAGAQAAHNEGALLPTSDSRRSSSVVAARPWVARSQLLAAGLLIVAGVLWVTARGKASPGADVLMLAANSALSPGATLWSARGWSASRASGDDVSIDVRSARLGVLSVDVLRATALGDSSGARNAKRMIDELLQEVTGGALIAAQLAQAGSIVALRGRLADARLLGDTARFDLAARLELLRVAGFRSPSVRLLTRDLDSLVASLQAEPPYRVATGEAARAMTPLLPDTAAILDRLLELLAP